MVSFWNIRNIIFKRGNAVQMTQIWCDKRQHGYQHSDNISHVDFSVNSSDVMQSSNRR